MIASRAIDAAALCLVLAGCSHPPHVAADDSGVPQDDACVTALEQRAPAERVIDGVVALQEPQACEAPLEGVRYVEVGAEWGLVGREGEDREHIQGGTLTVGDFDGDGDLDLWTGFAGQSPTVWWRDGDTLRPEQPLALQQVHGQLATHATDPDGDGVPELFGAGPPAFRVTWDGSGLRGGPLQSTHQVPAAEVLPFDIDRDGDSDLFAVSMGPLTDPELRADHLLRWEDGWSAEPLPAARAGGIGIDGELLDWDGDGDLDVFVANDLGAQHGGHAMWRNDLGVLVDMTDETGTGLVQSAMGVAFGDINRDGRPDLYTSATEYNALLVQQSDGSVVDVAQAAGADPLNSGTTMSWGSVMFDHDNDGRLDILVGQGDLWFGGQSPGPQEMPLVLLRQLPQDALAFDDLAPALGIDLQGSWRAVVAIDLNGDGVQDILAADVHQRARVFLSQGCTQAGWLTVQAPEHSRVELCADGQRQVAWTTPSSGALGSRPTLVHFGLGEAQKVDRLQVELLGGGVVVIEGPLEGRRGLRVGP